uniref:Gypsy retrotransposon integrase-like protein 1 n=1 Tax=Cyprinus carpio carpio TaxID=630221 RepID=A0A9J8BJ87_CYPCA
MRNGKLVRVSVDTEQLVVPEILRTRVLHLGHSIPWAGHLGQEKTEERIGSRFYWPGLHRAVVEYCKSCPECQLVVRSKRGMKAPLINLPVIDIPFTRIAMDVVGPLEKSRGGHRYILVVCDYATRYPEAFPLRHIKARQVANCLLQLFSRVGIPKEILTDQGTNFNSKFLKQVYTLLGIQGIKTTPYHPQTDGMVERFNQTLKSMLRKFVSDSGADWDQWLPYLLFAYREVPQASTGYSPFELLYGREVRGPLDVLHESWEGDASQQQTNIVSYVLKMREKLDQLSTLAHDNQIRSQSRQKTWYDRNARLRTFQPGQKVLLLLPSSESSLLAKWQGPFEVLRKLGQVTYEIAMPGRRQPQQVFHVNLLKQWNERSVPINEQRWACVVEEEEELKEQYFPTTKGKSVFPSVAHLSSEHQKELLHIIPKALFREEPGRTELITHDIRLKSAGPI